MNNPDPFLQDAAPSPDAAESYCCIFCESGYESLVAHTLEYCGYGRALFPQRVRPICRRGVWSDELRALLPGYVFMQGEAAPYDLRRINHVIRLLRYEDGTTALRGNDYDFARVIFRGNGMIPKLEAVREGDFVRVTDELLQNLNGRVRRVDKRKHLAEVEIQLAGTVNRVWLGLDLLETKEPQ